MNCVSSEAATGAAESGSEATGGCRLSDIPGRPREEETRLRDISFSRAEIVILTAALELYEKSLRKSDSDAEENLNDPTSHSWRGEQEGVAEGEKGGEEEEERMKKEELEKGVEEEEKHTEKEKGKTDERTQAKVVSGKTDINTEYGRGSRKRQKEEEKEGEEEEEEKGLMDIHPSVRGQILSYLSIPQLAKVAAACSSLSQEVSHPNLWRHLTVTNTLKENAARVAQREGTTVPEVILRRTRELHSLKLMGGVDFHEAWVTSIARFRETLTSFTLHITLTSNVMLDASLMALATECANLKQFQFIDKTIGRIPRFTAAGFRNAVLNMHCLEDFSVHVHNWIDTAINDDLLTALTTKPVKRICLEDQRSELTEVAITTLSQFKFLAQLEIRRCRLDEGSAATLRQLPHLEALQLLFVRGWTLPTWLQLLAPPGEDGTGVSKLRRLELPVYLGDEALALLPAACGSTLETLVLQGIELFNDFRSCFCQTLDNRLSFVFRKPTNDGMMTVLEGCPRLRDLAILMNNASTDYSKIDFDFSKAEFLDRRIACRLKEFRFEHADDRTSPIFLPIRTSRDGSRPETKYATIFLVYLIRNLGRAFGDSLERLAVKEVRTNLVTAASYGGWISLDKLLDSLQQLNKLTYLELAGLDVRMHMREDELADSQRTSVLSSYFDHAYSAAGTTAGTVASPAVGTAGSTAETAAGTDADISGGTEAAAIMTTTRSPIRSAPNSVTAEATRISPFFRYRETVHRETVHPGTIYRELMRWKLKNGTLTKLEISNCNVQIIMRSNPLQDRLKDVINSRATICIDESNAYHISYNKEAEDDDNDVIGGRFGSRIIQIDGDNDDDDDDNVWDIFAFEAL